MTKKFDAIGNSLALASATALEKLAARVPAEPAQHNEPVVALNFRVRQSVHKKLKAAALARDMTMTDLLEDLIKSLPPALDEALPTNATSTLGGVKI